jgi:glyoxylase-like metal-dependent hydrolase (beta-lactamase superfamily II)
MLTVQSFTFNPASENTYVVYNEKGMAIIFDPGCYFSEEQRALQAFIETKKLNIIQLINTHCHLDHVFGNTRKASIGFCPTECATLGLIDR